MAIWLHETRLLLRSRMAVIALVLLAVLSAAAVAAGMVEIARQRAAIAAIPAAQAEDVAAIADYVDREKDGGSAAYYTFHPTWDSPAPLAFAAIGMRDVAPYILRVRALGLEAQIYDGDTFNPELALPGRFDFAFVLVFLAPLFAIALFHDLKSGEREAGRARMLDAMPAARRLWLRRRLVRFALLVVALTVPFIVGALMSGVAIGPMLLIVMAAAAYLLFWIGLAGLVSQLGHGSTANAATLAGLWLILVLVIPTLANVVINHAIPVDEGAKIALAQRENVHHAWEIPREDTMRRFYASHPQLAASPPLPEGFHYKWYFAFHQNGDESVRNRVAMYRNALERRAATANALGWFLPSVGVQALLTRLAQTDLAAQFAYQDRIRDFHRRLRAFYYGYIFHDRPFGKADFAKSPAFDKST
ncbi:DUF3526 domain-containing protein [Sphingomonas sp. 2R-10]|uniref:DUF3526 domain-containing protein n=1 Tax=Sphingomonas sp. 2R-10 TaxID=3045148 RepID=UPI000F79E26C|nr:DUF3526 domain-containing protein [Sphingomonas sp. 2R-10]MDJ0275910.1 DUF3526 domain-containing protein [Sphingomonas sp. 2R-10]